MCILYDLILLIQKLLLNRHTGLSLGDKPTLSYRIHIYWLFIIFIYGVYYKSRMFFFFFLHVQIYIFFLFDIEVCYCLTYSTMDVHKVTVK